MSEIKRIETIPKIPASFTMDGINTLDYTNLPAITWEIRDTSLDEFARDIRSALNSLGLGVAVDWIIDPLVTLVRTGIADPVKTFAYEAAKRTVKEFWNDSGRKAIANAMNRLINWFNSNVRPFLERMYQYVAKIINSISKYVVDGINSVIDFANLSISVFSEQFKRFENIMTEIRKLSGKVDSINFVLSKIPYVSKYVTTGEIPEAAAEEVTV